ncbi:hypothetical protein GOODEAATRI_008293 [Goodea atripinnis]|uniref:Uncharacterized protein n=1 Tax=Goodea atripinnis TaxID=208336 RepID=A0ABV0MQB4_9TELE
MTPLPAVAALLLELSSIIQEAASVKGLFRSPVPHQPVAQTRYGLVSRLVVGQRPVPPFKHGKLVMKFADRAHQCAFQAAAVMNNTTLLAFGISKKAEEADLPEELKSFVCKAADAILNMCATSAACSSRIAAWSTLVQRATWLCLSPSMLEDLQKDMLEGPITPDAVFGYPSWRSHRKLMRSQRPLACLSDQPFSQQLLRAHSPHRVGLHPLNCL